MKHLKEQRTTLDSPYGALKTPGGGSIENGRQGTIIKHSTTEKCDVLFDEELNQIKVPCHWLNNS